MCCKVIYHEVLNSSKNSVYIGRGGVIIRFSRDSLAVECLILFEEFQAGAQLG